MSGGLSGPGCILSGGLAIGPHDRRSMAGWECRCQVDRSKSRRVVDQKDVLLLTVFEGSEVFHIDSLLSLPAMRSEETIADNQQLFS